MLLRILGLRLAVDPAPVTDAISKSTRSGLLCLDLETDVDVGPWLGDTQCRTKII